MTAEGVLAACVLLAGVVTAGVFSVVGVALRSWQGRQEAADRAAQEDLGGEFAALAGDHHEITQRR